MIDSLNRRRKSLQTWCIPPLYRPCKTVVSIVARTGRYRSGQTGQTVNLLAMPSKVRILPCPPFTRPRPSLSGSRPCDVRWRGRMRSLFEPEGVKRPETGGTKRSQSFPAHFFQRPRSTCLLEEEGDRAGRSRGGTRQGLPSLCLYLAGRLLSA